MTYVLDLPWRGYRERLHFGRLFVYEPAPAFMTDGPRRFSVPLSNRPHEDGPDPYTVEGFVEACRTIVDAEGYRPPVRSVGSRGRPWVKCPAGWNYLTEKLDVCRAANIGADSVFNGANLRVHVLPFQSDLRGFGHVNHIATLGLVGVEIDSWSGRWEPFGN